MPKPRKPRKPQAKTLIALQEQHIKNIHDQQKRTRQLVNDFLETIGIRAIWNPEFNTYTFDNTIDDHGNKLSSSRWERRRKMLNELSTIRPRQVSGGNIRGPSKRAD